MRKLFFFSLLILIVGIISCESDPIDQTQNESEIENLLFDIDNTDFNNGKETHVISENFTRATSISSDADFMYIPLKNSKGVTEVLKITDKENMKIQLSLQDFIEVIHTDGTIGYIRPPASRISEGCSGISNGRYWSVWRSPDSGIWYYSGRYGTSAISAEAAASHCKKK